MKKIVTLSNYETYMGLDITDDLQGDISIISALFNVNREVIEAGSADKLPQLKSEASSQILGLGKATALVKYKDKTFVYHPCDAGTIGDQLAMEVFSRDKKWEMLAALIFREVKGFSNWRNRKGWTTSNGLQVKPLASVKTLRKFSSKPFRLEDIEAGFWSDFPTDILFSNLAFTIGVGTTSSLTIQPNSVLQNQDQMKLLQEQIQQVLFTIRLQAVLPVMKRSTAWKDTLLSGMHLSSQLSPSTSTNTYWTQQINKVIETASGLTDALKDGDFLFQNFTRAKEIIGNDSMSSKGLEMMRLYGLTHRALIT